MPRCRNFVFLLTVLVFIPLALAQAQNQAQPTVELVGQWGGACQALGFFGTTALAGRGMQVERYEVTSPDKPELLARSELLGGLVKDLVINSQYAWAGLSNGDLVCLDLRKPGELKEISRLALEQTISGLALQGKRLYVANHHDALVVVDVSAPTQPKILQRASYPESMANVYSCDVAVKGNFAYVGTYDFGLTVWDLTASGGPAMIAQEKSAPKAMGLCLVGTTLYAADEDRGLIIFSLANPRRPVLLGKMNNENSCYAIGVTVFDSTAMLCSTSMATQIIDVHDPKNPKLMTQIPKVAYAGWLQSDWLALASDSNGLLFYRLDGAEQLKLLASSADHNGIATKLQIVDKRAYIADDHGGLQIIDISDPTAPTRLGNFDQPGCGSAYGLTVRGNLAYVAYGSGGLMIFDLSNPAEPERIGEFGMGQGLYEDLVLDGNYLFIASDANEMTGLIVLDVSDPTQAKLVANVLPNIELRSIRKNGKTLLMSSKDHIYLLDASNPRQIKPLGNLAASGKWVWNQGASFFGNSALVSEGNSGLGIVDIAQASRPRFKAELDFQETSSIADTVVRNGVAILADSYNGLRFVDLHNPAKPEIIGRFDTGTGPLALVLAGDYLYLACQEAGLLIYRLNP